MLHYYHVNIETIGHYYDVINKQNIVGIIVMSI